MGQDLNFKAQFRSAERTFEMSYDGRAHSYVLDQGEDILKMSFQIFKSIASQLGIDGEIAFESSRDFEGEVFAWGSVNAPKFGNIREDEDEDERENFPVIFVENVPEGGVKFVLGDENPEYVIFIQGNFEKIDLEPLAQIIENHTYKRVEFLGRNKDIPTTYAEWLGVKFEIEVLPVPEDLAFILSLELFPYGNKPNGISYFGIGNKTLVAREVNVQGLISKGKLCLWKIDGGTYIYLDPSLREKVGIGIALGKVNLPSDLIFSDYNKPYQEAYGNWLKVNNFRQFEKAGGIGNRQIHWFNFEP